VAAAAWVGFSSAAQLRGVMPWSLA
jgi:hypothetical protein